MKTKILTLLALSTLVFSVGCGTTGNTWAEKESSKFEDKIEEILEEHDVDIDDIEAEDDSAEDEASFDSDSTGDLYFIAEYDSDGNSNFAISYDEPGKFELTSSIEDLQKNGSIVATGADIAKAEAVQQANNATGATEYVVNVLFTRAGSEAFAEATEAASVNRDKIAIYYNGEIISCPIVEATISDGRCVINGLESLNEAKTLADKLNK